MAYLAGLCAALYAIALIGDALMARCWRDK
ncbi:hypothetical protein DFP87_12359 [Achromobacter marplatensis]|uniref:Uncharacterized protein n=1 Tax=Achromobacter marplatensis TaxID=470868 RepID=A0ABX9G086_9BURK|nr:hypothetical protein DFP87_12359 [Achromobacter marplatensis]CAB3711784.1 hypothetical protein LMG26219_05965 [Achromobacter marplatensis]